LPFLRLVRAWLSPAGTFEVALRITVSSVRFLAVALAEAGPSWTSLHSRTGRRFRRFLLLRPRTALRRSPRGIDREVLTPGRPFIDIILDGRCPAVFPLPGFDVLVEPRSDLAVLHDFAGVLHPSSGVSPDCSPLFLRRRTRGLVASRCQSWGSTRFLRWGGGAGPESDVIADVVLHRSRAVALPRVDFTPLGGFPPFAASDVAIVTDVAVVSKRVTALLASVDLHVSVRSFEALLRERVRTERASLRMFAGLPSLGLVPLRGHFVGSCVPMGFVGTPCLRRPHPISPIRSVGCPIPCCSSTRPRSVP
jgi:hypothetical protein